MWRKLGQGPTECGRRPPDTLVTEDPAAVNCPDCMAHYWWANR